MIDPKIIDAVNEQINAELYSAYLYLSMASYFESKNLMGFANWMRVQAMEEMTHARRFYAFLSSRSARIILTAIDAPPTEWTSPLHVFEEALAHEHKITALINGLMNLSMDLRDHAMTSFLQWFVTEQVEEESNVDAVIQSLKLVDNQAAGWFLLDKDLSARAFIAPIGLTI